MIGSKFILRTPLLLGCVSISLFSGCLNQTDGYQGEAKLSATFNDGCYVTSSDHKSFWLGVNSCSTDNTLKQALYNRIKNHTVIRYTDNTSTFDSTYTIAFMQLNNPQFVVPARFDVWDAYRLFAGKNANPYKSGANCATGKILDWYDYQCYDTPTQIMNPDNGGQQGSTGSDAPGAAVPNFGTTGIYNREHSWPKSWFLGSSASGYCANDKDAITGEGTDPYDYRAYTDLHHLIPARSAVNTTRSNCPFGIVLANDTNYPRTSGAKFGTPDTTQMPGHTWASIAGCTANKVFEPPPELKGDIARIYFYMTTRYYTEDSCWTSNSWVTRASMNTWLENVMRKWHNEDPVSTEELTRNDWIQRIQGNRNPFIDHPEWVAKISDF